MTTHTDEATVTREEIEETRDLLRSDCDDMQYSKNFVSTIDAICDLACNWLELLANTKQETCYECGTPLSIICPACNPSPPSSEDTGKTLLQMVEEKNKQPVPEWPDMLAIKIERHPASDDVEGVVERLRQFQINDKPELLPFPIEQELRALLREAAALIRSLVEERDGLERKLGYCMAGGVSARSQLSAAKSENERLREALEPFAEVVEWADGVQEGDREAGYPRHAELHMGSGASGAGYFVEFDDFLKARAVLLQGKP